jgi:vitamin B12 transporter
LEYPRRLCSSLRLAVTSFVAASFATVSIASVARAEEPLTIDVQGEARPDGELPNEPFVAASRVKRERLAAPAIRAAEVLRSEAGVQIAEGGGLGAPATASIRGATAAQTPVYLGGVRLNDEVGGVADLSTIPLWLVDHVDIYRGNAPFEAGDWGIGGAIFFEPRRPRAPEAAAGASLGSFGTRSGFGYFSAGNAGLRVLAGVSAERAQNDYEFIDDRGTLFESSDDARRRRSNADSHLLDVWALARAQPSQRARVELLLNSVAREQGAPKLALVPSVQARARLQRTLRTSLVDGTTQLDDPARELGLANPRTRVSGGRIEQQVALRLPLAASVDAGFAANASHESLVRLDGAAASSAAASTLQGVTRLEWQARPGFSLLGLLAAQCRSSQPGPGGCSRVEPTGRLGAGFRGSNYATYVNLSRYERQPALGELYGAGVLVRGNSSLVRELGLGADAGARGVLALSGVSLTADLSGFVRSASDLVAYTRTAQGYVVPVNVGRARVVGLELGVGAKAFGHLEAGCNLTLLDPRDTTEGRRLANDLLPFTSRLVLAPRLLLTTGDLETRALARADLQVDLSYLSSRFADSAGLIVIPDQATLGVTAALSWLSGVLVTRARLANALNTQRFDIVGYPLPGRSIYVSAEVHTP